MAGNEQTVTPDLAIPAQVVTTADTKRGPAPRFIAAMRAPVVAGFLGYLGHASAVGLVGTTTVVGPATAFVARRSSRSPDAGIANQRGVRLRPSQPHEHVVLPMRVSRTSEVFWWAGLVILTGLRREDGPAADHRLWS